MDILKKYWFIKCFKAFYTFYVIDRENFYTGRVFGEKASDVKLHMDDGLITGIIHTPDETYHIEVNMSTTPLTYLNLCIVSET